MTATPSRATGGPTPRLEVRDLRLMVAVAAEGSLTGAGKRLHVTQPALSRHLRSMEGRVGGPLFVRTGARMVPTPAGELLLRHARDVLDRVARTEADLRSLHDPPTRVLRVGTECYTGYHWLPAVSRRFAARTPSVEIEIAFDAARRPLRALRANRIDVALLTDDRPLPGIAVSRLFSDELVAVVAPPHSWAGRAFVEPAAFQDVRLLLLAPPQDSTVVSGFLDPAGVRPRHVADVQLVGAMAALVEADFGVGVLPAWTIAPEVRAGRLVPIRLGRRGLRRTWAAAVEKSRSREPWVAELVASIALNAPGATLG